jgi:hypothetical protein
LETADAQREAHIAANTLHISGGHVGLDPQLLSESLDHSRFSRRLFLDGKRGIRSRQSTLQSSRQSFEA